MRTRLRTDQEGMLILCVSHSRFQELFDEESTGAHRIELANRDVFNICATWGNCLTDCIVSANI